MFRLRKLAALRRGHNKPIALFLTASEFGAFTRGVPRVKVRQLDRHDGLTFVPFTDGFFGLPACEKEGCFSPVAARPDRITFFARYICPEDRGDDDEPEIPRPELRLPPSCTLSFDRAALWHLVSGSAAASRSRAVVVTCDKVTCKYECDLRLQYSTDGRYKLECVCRKPS